MIKNLFLSIILSIILFSVFNNCANPTNPTGGPRDTLPPLLVESVPKNKSTNFNGNRIEMIFDEFIKFEQAEEKLIITPSVESEFKTRWNKNRVTIIFDEDRPFEENTTYTFNFQDAIKDVNESNEWEDPRFVFSTGDYLDSLIIKGRVNYLMTEEPAKEGIVSLYFYKDTLDVLQDKPIYFTNISKEGYFSIENLPSATFEIYAIKDENNNLILDAQNEAYDFLSNPINTLELKDSIYFQYQYLNISPINLFSAQSIRGNFDFSFNKYITEYNLIPSQKIRLHSNFVDEHDKIRVYEKPIKPYSFDSLLVNISVEDSIGNVLDTALYVNFDQYEGPRPDFTQKFIPNNNQEIKENFKGRFIFNKPILSVNYDSLYFLYDSTNVLKLDTTNIFFNERKDEAEINIKLSRNQLPKDTTGQSINNISFFSGKGSFISVELDSSQTLSRNYSFYDPANFGIIKGNILSETNSFIIQLLDERYNVIYTIKNNSNYIFDMVEPANYFIRVLFDTNNNGEWDPGNLLEKEKPEPVIFYFDEEANTRKLSIKANWELTDINIRYDPVE